MCCTPSFCAFSPTPPPTGSTSLNDHATISRFPNLLRAALTINLMPLGFSLSRLDSRFISHPFDLFHPPHANHPYIMRIFPSLLGSPPSSITTIHVMTLSFSVLCSSSRDTLQLSRIPFTHKGRFINTIASYTPHIFKYPSSFPVSLSL